MQGLVLLDSAGDMWMLTMVSVFKERAHISEDKVKIIIIISMTANIWEQW